ncbi:MAG: CAMP factor family pore-forming toxin [Ezakiella sp.]|nr:CAMP factor family pore-forming toxin [Ezakiella sp.]MDD7471902.1 CAMP factor family pore-forming toxin [Bacillota bacterium]MDY3923866.1 CAMP factor family pore-forming toxin [Ezakiella sp.]
MKIRKTLALLLAFMMVLVYLPTVVNAAQNSELIEDDYNPYIKLSETEALKGGIEVNRPGKPLGMRNVPLMAAAHADALELAQLNEYQLPSNALRFNEQTIYDLDSIVPRIKLIGVTINFIHRCCTELIYRNQYTHQTAAREAGIAIAVALNPFNTIDDIENACQKLIDLYEEMKNDLAKYPEVTANDNATIHIKNIFNKDLREARILQNNYLDVTSGKFGVKGKAQSVQNSYRAELDAIQRSIRGTVTVGFVVEADNKIKAASTSAILAPEVSPAPTWIRNTINPEYNEFNRMVRSLTKYLPRTEITKLNDKIRSAKAEINMRGATYKSIADGVYETRELFDQTREIYQKAFADAGIVREDRPEDIEPMRISWYNFEVPKEEVDPAVLAKIHWINNPTFDFTPSGFEPSPYPDVIVGFALGKPVYGTYEEWMDKRFALRNVEDVTAPDWDEEEPTNPIDDGGIEINFGW